MFDSFPPRLNPKHLIFVDPKFKLEKYVDLPVRRKDCDNLVKKMVTHPYRHQS